MPFFGKPVALQSAASGLLGGGRMQYHLRRLLTSLEAQVLNRPEVFVRILAKEINAKTAQITDQPTTAHQAAACGFEKFIRAAARADLGPD